MIIYKNPSAMSVRQPTEMSRLRVPTGFTLIEVLIVIVIVGLLAALLFPVFARARENARATSCVSNLRQIGQALSLYVADYDGYWPRTNQSNHGYGWGQTIHSYLKSPINQLGCPNVVAGDPTLLHGAIPGYGYNTALDGAGMGGDSVTTHDAQVRFCANTVSISEQPWRQATSWGPNPYKDSRVPDGVEKAWKRHRGGANYLFCDSHIHWYTPDMVGYNIIGSNSGDRPTFALGDSH